MTQRQIEGSIVILVIAVLSYVAVSLHTKYQSPVTELPFSNKRSGSLIVKLTGNTDRKGIYYLPEGAKLSDLFLCAEVSKRKISKVGKRELEAALKSGMVVFIDENGSLTLGNMATRDKIALDIPIDINQATVGDLQIVPGIGDRMALQIVTVREQSGGFKELEELKTVKGIKGKKFDALKRYFIIEDARKRQ
jgi:competence protein ComEA